MGKSKIIVKNTSYLYIKMVIVLVIQFYAARVFLSTLGASDYGLYILISGVIFMFGFLQDTLTRSSLRHLCFYKEKRDLLSQKKVYTISIILHFVISIIIVLNLVLISDYLFSDFLKIDEERVEAAKLVYYFMIGSFALTVISVPYDSILNANENMFYYSFVGIIESFMKLGLALYLPYTNSDKLIVYALLMSMITVISLLAKGLYCQINYEECNFKFLYFDKQIAKDMVSYAGWNFLTSITSLISFNSIPVLLNIFFGTILNAAQGIAVQINGVVTQFSSNMMKALSPTITKNGTGNNIQKMITYSFTGTKISYFILCVLVIPLIVECSLVLKLWLVNVPAWTKDFCTLILLNTLLYQLIAVFVDCIYTNDKIRNYCIIKGFLNILPLFLIYFSFVFGGSPYMVYVIIILIWDILGGIVIIMYNKKFYGLKIWGYLKDIIFPCLLISLIVFLIGRLFIFLLEPSFIRLLINTMVMVISIIILSWLLLFNKEEKYLMSIITKTIKEKFFY